MAFFLSNPVRLFARHLYSHAWFDMSLAMLGSTRCCYVNGGKGGSGSNELLLLLVLLCSDLVSGTVLSIELIRLMTMMMKAEAINYCYCGVVVI